MHLYKDNHLFVYDTANSLFYSMRSKDNPHVRTVEGRAGEWCFEESGVGETNERNRKVPLGD